ncbi:hypothetical protein CH1034_300108 [Klebsiella pneumoniae]|nr:hypothetical protein CH1034_300108 [Klebsiella pneumoniae]
MIAFDGEEA